MSHVRFGRSLGFVGSLAGYSKQVSTTGGRSSLRRIKSLDEDRSDDHRMKTFPPGSCGDVLKRNGFFVYKKNEAVVFLGGK